jgi:Sulfatase-modifying factor enzyme 1
VSETTCTAVSDRLSEAIGVYVGTDLSPYPAPELRFIRFEARSAFFENGSTVQLAPYEICRSQVTTGQFDQFCAATAHVTTCEHEGNGSFRLDETIEGVRPRDRGNIPVHSVSFDDALAYCHWARVRLPTEAELLAAALVDYRIMSSLEKENFLFGAVGGRFEIDRFPDALAGLATEFVAGCSVPGNAIIRNGPYYVRETGWETQRRRHECRTDAYDLMTGFRVCRTTPNAT